MKRILSILLVVAAALGITACARSERIAVEQVPNSLRVFVQDNFGKDVKMVAAERERKSTGFEYEVTLSNGCEIDYGASNEWLEVDANHGTVPASIVGDEISDHIAVAYPAATVKKISRKAYGYEVELNNGIDLKYDHSYKFIGIDK